MSLIPVIAISNSLDLSTINVADITGAYDPSLNPGGYGTPNTALTDVTLTALLNSVYYPTNGGPAIPIYNDIVLGQNLVVLFPTTANPAPYLLNEVYAITPAMMGMAGPNVPDGIYSFQYSVSTLGGSIQGAFTNYLMCGNAFCCIQKLMCKVKIGDCGCGGTKDVFYYKNMLDAAIFACACLKNAEALAMLNEINLWCASQDCNCN